MMNFEITAIETVAIFEENAASGTAFTFRDVGIDSAIEKAAIVTLRPVGEPYPEINILRLTSRDNDVLSQTMGIDDPVIGVTAFVNEPGPNVIADEIKIATNTFKAKP